MVALFSKRSNLINLDFNRVENEKEDKKKKEKLRGVKFNSLRYNTAAVAKNENGKTEGQGR